VTIVANAEPEFALAMLIKNGGHGMQTFAEFREAFFAFDGFGFLHVVFGG
jgi:hypothetical protein